MTYWLCLKLQRVIECGWVIKKTLASVQFFGRAKKSLSYLLEVSSLSGQSSEFEIQC